MFTNNSIEVAKSISDVLLEVILRPIYLSSISELQSIGPH